MQVRNCPVRTGHGTTDWFQIGKGVRQGCIYVQVYCTSALISHASKVILKILQIRIQQYVNRELSDILAGFRKDRGTRDQIANIR